jgi:hypothetical protein
MVHQTPRTAGGVTELQQLGGQPKGRHSMNVGTRGRITDDSLAGPRGKSSYAKRIDSVPVRPWKQTKRAIQYGTRLLSDPSHLSNSKHRAFGCPDGDRPALRSHSSSQESLHRVDSFRDS